MTAKKRVTSTATPQLGMLWPTYCSVFRHPRAAVSWPMAKHRATMPQSSMFWPKR